jgi:integrase/recombinase XerD
MTDAAPESLALLERSVEGPMSDVEEKTGSRSMNAGATTPNQTSQMDVKGKILEFLWHLKKLGRKETTVKSYGKILTALAKQTDILNPNAVLEYLAKAPVNDTTKHDYAKTLNCFYQYLGIKWQVPSYKPLQKIPYIPTEAEIDTLIANTSKTVSALLQLLKETGMRVGEALALKWTDIDFERKTVRITAEKGSLPRILPLSEKCLTMLNRLPRKSEKIFPSKTSLDSRFYVQRKRIAHKLCNPRLLKISFHTLRHWKGTMEYHKTKDIIHVQRLLGHKNIQNTLIYITIENALFTEANDEFHVRTAKTVEEACKLVEVGFEYVTEIDGIKIFRKRK